MSIAAQISALEQDRYNIRLALAEKGVSAADHGFDDFAGDIENMPAGTMGDILVSGTGLVSSRISSGGYMTAGTEKTLQLSVQGAAAIVPSSSQQIAVQQGKFATGDVVVSAVPTESKIATDNGTVSPTPGKYLDSVIVEVRKAVPIELDTAAEMASVLISANVGKAYIYTGPTDSTYTNGDIYIVEV